MTDRAQQSESGRQTAEDFRRRARQMLEQRTPEERRELERFGEALAREAHAPHGESGSATGAPGTATGGPGDQATADRANVATPPVPERDRSRAPAVEPGAPRVRNVDARRTGADGGGRDPGRERVVAEWLSQQPADRGSVSTAAPEPAELLREAQRSAERALEQKSVPARYDRYVRRYFQRLDDGILRPANPAVPGPPARPVPSAPDAK
ncbi:MAG: hypothetical protein JNM07_01970 [Phycisphaerae bacterium]|nr:hypothetical protein [Phycisphaerae bacterium]